MTVTIVGRGGMGKLFARIMSAKWLQLSFVGRDVDPKALAKSDVIVIATPSAAAAAIAKTLRAVPAIDKKLIICLWSYMQTGSPALEAIAPVVYLHFLFGPDIDILRGQNIVAAGDYQHRLFAGFAKTLKAQKARVHYTDKEFHDKIMAYTQCLSQYSSILLGKSLAQSGYSYEQLRDFASLTFRLNRYTIERIMRQKSELWGELQFANKNFGPVLREYMRNADEMTRAIEAKDEAAYIKMFEEAAAFWRSASARPEQSPPAGAPSSKVADITALGPEGTYSQQAIGRYDPKIKPLLVGSIQDVITTVSEGVSRRGLIPLENSIEGIVSESFDGLFRNGLTIEDEVVLDIHHALCGLERPQRADQVLTIYSHPQALAQCRDYLRREYPKARLEPVTSTTAGMRMIVDQKDLQALAIGPEFGAEMHGLTIVDRDIEDEAGNQTRFVVFSKRPRVTKPLDFILIAVIPETDRPGLLHDILEIIKNAGINLSQIDSRPNRNKLGSYMFYIKLELSGADKKYDSVIKKIQSHNVKVRRMSA